MQLKKIRIDKHTLQTQLDSTIIGWFDRISIKIMLKATHRDLTRIISGILKHTENP